MSSRARMWRVSHQEIVRNFLGILLLFAAGLKTHQLSTEPLVSPGILSSRLFVIALIQFEIVLGCWLISGWLPRASTYMAIVCFAVFACHSLFQSFAGSRTCGCFGKFAVNPIWAFGVDLFAVLALFWTRAVLAERSRDALFFKLRSVAACFVWAGLSLGSMAVVHRFQPTVDGVAIDADSVVIEPLKLRGKEFPLFGWIDIGDELATGRWNLVFYHHDCPKCQDRILAYRQALNESRNLDWELVLIELPPHGDGVAVDFGGAARHGRALGGRPWMAPTPLEVSIEDGVVVQVSF